MRNAVVLICDDRIFPAAAFAAYRLASLNKRDDTDIFIFTDAMAEVRAAASRGYPFRVLPIVPPGGVAIRPALFRIVVPVQMASRYARVLYLDIDTYAESERLFDVFDLDMRGHALAAVRDYFIVYSPDQAELDAVLGGKHVRYFNSGMLLIDCQRYVARGALEGISRAAQTPIKVGYLDQSVLNLYFNGDFLELSPAFNLFAGPQWQPLARACPPLLTHFTGGNKPWRGGLFQGDHRARAEMERFFPPSPWPGFLPRFFNLGTITNPPESSHTRSIPWGSPAAEPILRYLRETEFADVSAGITEFHLEALKDHS